MSKDYAAPASTRFRAAHSSGARMASEIRNVAVHSTEGPTAESAASWFQNPLSEGSANMVVDDEIAYRTLDDLVIPWAIPNLNTPAWHLEFAGYAHWTRAQWLAHPDMLQRGAYKAALRCKRFNVPLRWVGPIGLRLHRRGLTTHRDGSFAWPLVARRFGFHTDPGPGFPKDVFLTYVRRFVGAM